MVHLLDTNLIGESESFINSPSFGDNEGQLVFNTRSHEKNDVASVDHGVKEKVKVDTKILNMEKGVEVSKDSCLSSEHGTHHYSKANPIDTLSNGFPLHFRSLPEKEMLSQSYVHTPSTEPSYSTIQYQQPDYTNTLKIKQIRNDTSHHKNHKKRFIDRERELSIQRVSSSANETQTDTDDIFNVAKNMINFRKERSRQIDSNINDTGVKLLVTGEKQEKRGKQEEETELLHRATGFNNINAIDKNANKNSLVSINNSHTMNSTKNKEIANNMALICSSDFQNKSKDQYKAHSNNNYSSHPFIYPHKKRENFKTFDIKDEVKSLEKLFSEPNTNDTICNDIVQEKIKDEPKESAEKNYQLSEAHVEENVIIEDNVKKLPTTLLPRRTGRLRKTTSYEKKGLECTPESHVESEDIMKYSKVKLKYPAKNCRECVNCLTPDCGKCLFCLDKPKFGGSNQKKQRCQLKSVCEKLVLYKKEEKRSILNKKPQKKKKTVKPDKVEKRCKSSKIESVLKSIDPIKKYKKRKKSMIETQLSGGTNEIKNKYMYSEIRFDKNTSKIIITNIGHYKKKIKKNNVQHNTKVTTSIDQNNCKFQDEDVLVNKSDDDGSNEMKTDLTSNPKGLRNKKRRKPTECYNEKVLTESSLKEWPTEPLPAADPVPDLPYTSHCTWTFDKESRVLLAKFHDKAGKVVITETDERFMLLMMERNDITVVSEGLVNGLNKKMWNLDYIKRCVGDRYYHKIRSFRKETKTQGDLDKIRFGGKQKLKVDNTDSIDENQSFISYKEEKGLKSMRILDYISYLKKRDEVLKQLNKHKKTTDYDLATKENVDDLQFEFSDHKGNSQIINVVDTVLYLIDFDVSKMLPRLSENFKESFRFPGFLPGGKHCMMNSVNYGGRPFMGPNLYISPPASYTHFHQDGHGTVDSGHACLAGYNEVVMLRRMSEHRKKHALHLLNCADRTKGKPFFANALYELPHSDTRGEKSLWPDQSAIAECKKMNYCPSVFVLKPGQFVHINKGRLHAFRKLAPENLSENDCHAALRKEIIINENLEQVETVCLSIAWDWMYTGFTSEGINEEISSALLCAQLNRKKSKQSLGIPETSLLHMAQLSLAEVEHDKFKDDECSHLIPLSLSEISSNTFVPSPYTVLKGIVPSLEYLVKSHSKIVSQALEKKSDTGKERINVHLTPDAWENPDLCELDPFGNGDFFCKFCSQELSNVYMHCDGCEEILRKDFNVCANCHAEGCFRQHVQMHPLSNEKHSTVNHTGGFQRDRQVRCPCKRGPRCRKCGYCAGCSCRCHKWFTLHLRFMGIEGEQNLLNRAKAAIGDDMLACTEKVVAELSNANGHAASVNMLYRSISQVDSDNLKNNNTVDTKHEKALDVDNCVLTNKSN